MSHHRIIRGFNVISEEVSKIINDKLDDSQAGVAKQSFKQ